jgi:outer membrane protein assembly factor BamB
MVYAVDLKTGRIRWERELRRAVPLAVKHEKNTYASETPVTDGERVYAYFGGVGLFAFDMQGKPLWSKPMDPLKMRGWGTGASPIVHQNRVYIVNDNDEQSSLIAYDSRTGDVVWRVAREEGSNWSTPFIWEHALGTEIVTTGSRKVRSYSLDGKLKWELAGMTSLHVPTPFAIDGLLFISSGFLADPVRPVYAIRPGASGDISLKEGERSNPFVAWSNPRLGTYGTSGLVYGDYYYTLLDRGFLVCNDAKTGKEVYPRQRITAEASGFTASPWAYNGKIFALSEDGDTFVMQAGPEFKVLGRNSLGEMALATPAVAGDSLIIRTASKLYRISNKR